MSAAASGGAASRREPFDRAALLTALLAVALYAWPVWIYRMWDLPAHIDLLQKAAAGEASIPHFVFHLATWVLGSATGLSLHTAGMLVELLAQGVAGYYVYRILAARIADTRLRVGLALACLALGPISLFTYPKLYLGYVGINVPHNPTVMALKPIALATVYHLERYLEAGVLDPRRGALLAGLFVLGLLTKPAFHESLVLLTTALVGWRVLRGGMQPRHLVFWATLSAGVLAVLWLQAQAAFSSEHRLGLCFGCIYDLYSGGPRNTVLLIGLSLAVPLLAARLVWRDTPLLAPLLYAHLAGTLLVSLVVHEVGPRYAAGNFLWHVQLPLLVAMVYSLRALACTRGSGWTRALWALAALQLVSGLFFLYGVQHAGLAWLDRFGLPPDLRITS